MIAKLDSVKELIMTTPVVPGKRRGIYLLPNLFTTAALFAGFYAVVAALKGFFDTAAIAIFIAMILDGLDGRVARLTGTQSEFGAQYDSLSDLVSFGIAPSLVLYSWILQDLGKPGWLVAFLYTVCGALRLARFNTQLTDKKFFQGLPIPSAAAVVASLVWVGHKYAITGLGMHFVAAFIMSAVALLMVSNVRYYSFKEIDLKGRVPFIAIILLVLIFVFVSIDPPEVLLGSFFLYTFVSPLVTFIFLSRQRKKKIVKEK